jgi:hypothetical protein
LVVFAIFKTFLSHSCPLLAMTRAITVWSWKQWCNEWHLWHKNIRFISSYLNAVHLCFSIKWCIILNLFPQDSHLPLGYCFRYQSCRTRSALTTSFRFGFLLTLRILLRHSVS